MPPSSTPQLRMSGVTKSFGPTAALKGVSFEVFPGEVHALIGENGAGKSTLMKILSGACLPDSGCMELGGKIFAPQNPLEALRHGIAMIYQELNLAPQLSVEENITLGAELHRLGWLRRQRLREKAKATLAQLHHETIPLDAPVHSLSIAEKQIVEIARALLSNPSVLIMDEPTSSLTGNDAENLFAVVRTLSERGVSIIYISHFLEECQKIAHRYTVLRDGESVGRGNMAEAEWSQIIQLMVGRHIDEIYPQAKRQPGKPLLEINRLKGLKKPRQASLVLHEGEIHGLAGLIGAGRTETVRVVFGLDPLIDGTVIVAGKKTARRSPDQSLVEGMGLLSENRKEEGLMLNRSLLENLTLTRLNSAQRWGLLDGRKLESATRHWIEKLNIRCQRVDQSPSELSGGNQQKLALARLLHHEAKILLLDEPTRGIDVGSKAEIYRLMGQLAEQGRGIIFISSYLPELLGVCDTISVMCRGILVETRPASNWTEEGILAAALGHNEIVE